MGIEGLPAGVIGRGPALSVADPLRHRRLPLPGMQHVGSNALSRTLSPIFVPDYVPHETIRQ